MSVCPVVVLRLAEVLNSKASKEQIPLLCLTWAFGQRILGWRRGTKNSFSLLDAARLARAAGRFCGADARLLCLKILCGDDKWRDLEALGDERAR